MSQAGVQPLEVAAEQRRGSEKLPWRKKNKTLTLDFAMHVIQLCRNSLCSEKCGLHNNFISFPLLLSSSHSARFPLYLRKTHKHTPLTQTPRNPCLLSALVIFLLILFLKFS